MEAKRIKLSKEEIHGFDSVQGLKCGISTMSQQLASAEKAAWEVIHINYGDTRDNASPYYAAHVDHITQELVCPVWDKNQPKAGVV